MSSKKKIILLGAVVSSCLLMNSVHAEIRPEMQNRSHQCFPGNNPGHYNEENVNGREFRGGKLLKTDSVEKIQGVVQSVNRVQYPNGTQIQLMVETENHGLVKVILGPATYMDRVKVKLQSGDKVVVKGYMITGNGEQALMASEVNKGGNILQLRDANRQPIWGDNSPRGNSNMAPPRL